MNPDETPLTDAQLREREDAATRALLAPDEIDLGKIKLRPITLGSLTLLQVTKNEFLTPRGEPREFLNPETGAAEMRPTLENSLFAALAFAYIHGAPLAEVRRAVWSEAFFNEQVIAFGDALAPEAINFLTAEIQRGLADIQTLQFSIKPKPDDKPAENAPPNS